MALNFRKMHGLGNDFVIIDNRLGNKTLTPEQIRLISDRRFGAGCDQLMLLEPGQGRADCFMRIYNPDASEAGACGNGTRCVAAMLMEESRGKLVSTAQQ